jgi:hypothetical protein
MDRLEKAAEILGEALAEEEKKIPKA